MMRFYALALILLHWHISCNGASAADGEYVRQEMFLDQYVASMKQKPEMFLGQMAWMVDVANSAGGDVDSNAVNSYRKLLTDKDLNATLAKIQEALPEIGTGVGWSPKFKGIDFSLEAKYDVKPLLFSVVRRLMGVTSPKEIEDRLKEISQQQPNDIRGLGYLAYISFKNTKELAPYSPLVQLAQVGTPGLPSPDDPPSKYLNETSNPYVRTWVQAQLSPLSAKERQRIMSDWGAFTKLLGGSLRPQISSASPNIGLKLAAKNQLLFDNNNDRNKIVSDIASDVLMAILSGQAPSAISKSLHDQAQPPNTPQYEIITKKHRQMQEVFNVALQLSEVIASPEDTRGVLFTSHMMDTSFNVAAAMAAYEAYTSDISNKDPSAAISMMTSGLHAGLAFAKAISMFTSKEEKGTVEIYKALFTNQRHILLQLNRVAQEIQRLSTLNAESRTAMRVESRIQALQFQELLSRTDEASSLVLMTRVEVMDALGKSAEQVAIQAHGQLVTKARSQIIMSALAKSEPSIVNAVQEDFQKLDTYLKRSVTSSPILPTRTIDLLLKEKRTPDSPWAYFDDAVAVTRSAGDKHWASMGMAPGEARFWAEGSSKKAEFNQSLAKFKKSSNTKLILAHPEAFFRGVMHLTDAAVRFPRAFTLPLDIGEIRRIGDESSNFLEAGVSGANLLQLAINFSQHSARRHWADLVSGVVEAAIPAAIDSNGAAEWVPKYFVTTNFQAMPADFNCIVSDACTEKSSLPVQDPIEFLTGLGVLSGRIGYVRGTDSDWALTIGHQSSICFKVREVVHWTRDTLGRYAGSIVNAERSNAGYAVSQKKVCQSFLFHPTVAEYEKYKLDKQAFIWQKYFADDIRRTFKDAKVDSSDPEPKTLRNESQASATRVLLEKGSSIRLVMKELASKSNSETVLRALDETDRYAGALFIVNYSMKPSCQTFFAIRYIHPVLDFSVADQIVGSSARVARALEQEDFAFANRLIGAGSDSGTGAFFLDSSACYQQPRSLFSAMDYLDTVRRMRP